MWSEYDWKIRLKDMSQSLGVDVPRGENTDEIDVFFTKVEVTVIGEHGVRKEFENRLAYANLRFKSEGIPGWKTDRGRIYMYLGPPDQVYEQPYLNYSNLKGYLVWVYYKYRLGVEFMDRTGTNKYDLKIDSTYSFRLMNAIDRAKFGLIYSVEAEMEKKPGQIEVDFDNEKREIVVRIPSSSLFYKEENGYLVVDLRFDFYIYSKNGIKKDRFLD